MSRGVLLGSILFVNILFIFSIIAIVRHKYERTLHDILDILDQSLNGHKIKAAYDESMDSAITERLNRILQISDLQKSDAQKERDNVKSLVSDISHQVRTPLSNIMLYSGLLKEQTMDSSTKHLVDKILAQSDKLDFLIKELVNSSRIEQEMIQVSCSQIMMADVIHSSCQLIEVKALEKHITIQYDEQEAFCYADQRWSVEAISNVLDNAIKYSPAHSIIRIQTKLYDSFVCVSIQDEGIGIEESSQGLIFQRFYRESTVSDTPGFGIGLYLVREVLTKQGGYVKVVSKPQEGAIFHLYFRRYSIL